MSAYDSSANPLALNFDANGNIIGFRQASSIEVSSLIVAEVSAGTYANLPPGLDPADITFLSATLSSHIVSADVHYDKSSINLGDLGDVNNSSPSNGQVLTFQAGEWSASTNPAGVTDHGLLTGLNDNDHPQYTLSATNLGLSSLVDDLQTSANDADSRLDDLEISATDTQSHKNNSNIHFEIGDKILNELSGVNINSPADGQGLVFSAGELYSSSLPAGGGSSDHGALAGLEDNDHPQYVLSSTNNELSSTVSDLQTSATDADSRLTTIEGWGIDDLSDVSTVGGGAPAGGNYLKWDSTLSQWVGNGVFTEPPQDLSGLDDTTIDNPQENQLLYFSGGVIVNAYASSFLFHNYLKGLGDNDHPQYVLSATNNSLSSLVDELQTSATDTETHKNDSTIHFTLAERTIDDLSGVNAASPSDLQGLIFSGGQLYASSLPNGVTDHGLLAGLDDNDHPQYVLSATNASLSSLANSLQLSATESDSRLSDLETSATDTQTHKEDGTIHFTLAERTINDLSGVNATSPSDLQGLIFSGGQLYASSLPNGVTDHGLLTGLSDNDHPQYVLSSTNSSLSSLVDTLQTSATSASNRLDVVEASATTADSRLDDLETSATDTQTHKNDTTIHFDIGDKTLDDLSGVNVTAPSDGEVLVFSGGQSYASALPAGTTDHGALGGLGDNDHPQYVLSSTNNALSSLVSDLETSATDADSRLDTIEAWNLTDLNDVNAGSPDQGEVLAFSGSDWVDLDVKNLFTHGDIAGLGDNDHPQYVLSSTNNSLSSLVDDLQSSATDADSRLDAIELGPLSATSGLDGAGLPITNVGDPVALTDAANSGWAISNFPLIAQNGLDYTAATFRSNLDLIRKNPTASSDNEVSSGGAAVTPLTLKGNASQILDMFTVEDSNGNSLFRIANDGTTYALSGAQTSSIATYGQLEASATDLALPNNSIGDLGDVDIAGATLSQVLAFSGGVFIPSSIPPGGGSSSATVEVAHVLVSTTQNVGGADGNITYVDWESQLRVDSGFTHSTVSNPSRIQVDSDGRYQIVATISAEQGGGARTTLRTFLRVNGSTIVDRPSARNYSRGNGYGDMSMNLVTELDLSSGDYLEVGVEVDDTDSTYTINTFNDECEFIVRKLSSTVEVSSSSDLNPNWHGYVLAAAWHFYGTGTNAWNSNHLGSGASYMTQIRYLSAGEDNGTLAPFGAYTGTATTSTNAAVRFQTNNQGMYIADNRVIFFRVTLANTASIQKARVGLWGNAATPTGDGDPTEGIWAEINPSVEGTHWRLGSSQSSTQTVTSCSAFPFSTSEFQMMALEFVSDSELNMYSIDNGNATLQATITTNLPSTSTERQARIFFQVIKDNSGGSSQGAIHLDWIGVALPGDTWEIPYLL